ncbi:MAG: PilZ domain-containing protein [Armatimonadetes bacterium]|nr:PilZ domain-containing protein [Armatimonadota bacterium]
MGETNDYQDSRKHARFELLEYAVIQDGATGQSVRSVVTDVSLGGLQIRSRHQFDPGQQYTLNIGRISSEPLVVTAEARYCIHIEDTDLYATGFRCQLSSTAERIDWVEYVHGIFQTKGESLVQEGA